MYTELKDGKVAIHAKSRQEWRNWLSQHAGTEKSVWLILFHKKSKTESVNQIEATEEALCFGWIDSLCKKRDSESYYLTFSPRKANSNWSKPNIQRAQRLISEGLMTERGLKLIEIAIKKGKWVRNFSVFWNSKLPFAVSVKARSSYSISINGGWDFVQPVQLVWPCEPPEALIVRPRFLLFLFRVLIFHKPKGRFD